MLTVASDCTAASDLPVPAACDGFIVKVKNFRDFGHRKGTLKVLLVGENKQRRTSQFLGWAIGDWNKNTHVEKQKYWTWQFRSLRVPPDQANSGVLFYSLRVASDLHYQQPISARSSSPKRCLIDEKMEEVSPK